MYSGEYDACDVTLSVYPQRASLKNMPDHGGNRTYDLWNTSPMLCQLSYAVWSVRVCDISEQNLVPSISMLSNNNHDFFCVGVMYSGEYDACDVTLSVYPHQASLKNMPDHGGNRTYAFGHQANALPTELRGLVGSSILHQQFEYITPMSRFEYITPTQKKS